MPVEVSVCWSGQVAQIHILETDLADFKVDNVAESLRVASRGRVGHGYRFGIDSLGEMWEKLGSQYFERGWKCKE